MPQAGSALRSVPCKVEANETRSVLSRAMSVLYAFDERRPNQTLSQLARSTNLPKTTVHRIVHVLEEQGALVRRGNHYEIGCRFLELASLSDVSRVRDVALPFLQEVHGLTRQTVHLAVLDGVDVLYIEKIGADATNRSVSVPSRVGTRRPAYCTALGKVLLAFGPAGRIEQVIHAGLVPFTPSTITDPDHFRAEMASVYAQGVACDRQELQSGVTCAAVPVTLGGGTATAAISIAGAHDELDLEYARAVLTRVRVPLTRALQQRGRAAPVRPMYRAVV